MVALQNTEVEAGGGLSPLKQAICERIANGATIRQLEKLEGFPSRDTVLRWRNLDADFDKAITRAYQCAGTAYADEVIAIADRLRDGEGDWAKDRCAMDGYKWAAAKFYPKMFGEQSPRTLHQTYVAGDVKVVADEGQRKAMIDARQKFLKPGDKPGDKPSPDA
jgi:hypothetical protein